MGRLIGIILPHGPREMMTMAGLSGRNTNIARSRLGCRLPYEHPGIGDGYASAGPVITYALSPEELARYGPPRRRKDRYLTRGAVSFAVKHAASLEHAAKMARVSEARMKREMARHCVAVPKEWREEKPMETKVPANAKPIVDFELIYNFTADQINEKGLPLCPHCGEWSYYTDAEADRNGGYTVCPFCGGAMFICECKTCVWFKDWTKEKTIFDDFRPEWGTTCLNLDSEDWREHPNPDPYDVCEHHVITRDHKPDPAWSMLVGAVAKAIEDDE